MPLRVASTDRLGRAGCWLSTVPGMACGLSFIAVLVVAGYPSHQLLRFDNAVRFNFEHELFSVTTSQRRRASPPMKNLDFTSLALSVGEAQVGLFGRLFHVLVGCRSCECPAFAGICHVT